MVRMLQQILLLAVWLLGMERAGAFALIGPNNEAYQSDVIGYNPNGFYDLLPTGPKNIGEEYRWNKPVLFYSYNENFLEYFGVNGAAAIDEAFAVLNGITNVSSYSAELLEVPLESRRDNFLAQSLSLYDLKTEALTSFVEQLGLAEPERYIWALHNRYLTPGGECPQDMVYDVIMRNFDPVTSNLDQLQPSKYVNGTRYYYIISEYCTADNSPAPPLLADAVEFPIDPTATTFSAVASRTYGYGGFYNGMTRDDIAGLRYLLRTNNMNIESAGPDTFTFVTNTAIQLLFTSNLTELIEAAYVNDAGALTALFPGLQISSTTQIFTNLVTTNLVFFFVNDPWSWSGTPARLTSIPVVTTNVAIRYQHEFANVVTNNFFTNGTITVLTTNISAAACPPWVPGSLICQSITQTTIQTNGVFGDYYLIPTNACGVSIVATQLIQPVFVTNSIVVATNDVGVTNIFNQEFSQTTIYTFNQHIFQVRNVVCPTNTVARRQGIERVRFERRDFDSLLNRFFYPVTNTYTLVALTNNTLVPQVVQRIITSPDFLISAEDLAPGPGAVIGAVSSSARSITFNEANAAPGLAGPGTIETGAVFTFNKVGPIYQNFAPNFLDEANGVPWFIWGSFDSSTNPPTVYPNGTSIVNLENQVLIQVSPLGAALPDAPLNQSYALAFGGFTVSGGTAPYNWSLVTGGGGLPPGLNLIAATGQIVGSPTTQNIYDFTIRMTDATGRFVEREYSIAVTP